MLDTLLQQFPGVWRAASLMHAQERCVSTGYPKLDAALGGGWPQPALIELLCDQWGIGELQLLRPLLQQLASCPSEPPLRAEPDVVLWLNPPHALHAIALTQYGISPAQHWTSDELNPHDTLWAMEQALRSGACGLVLAWAARTSMASLRRLKLAAAAGRCLGVLFRPIRETVLPSPANLRAELHAHGAYLHVSLHKVQGRLPASVMIPLDFSSEVMRASHERQAPVGRSQKP